jgi:cytochrome c nitrite reductase small subunit
MKKTRDGGRDVTILCRVGTERDIGRGRVGKPLGDAKVALPAILIAALIGAAAGLGGFTFRYAEGLSYFSTDPKACANCHVMNDQYASWVKGPHHATATCSQCHLPHDFFGKYLAKAENGYHHSKGFTLEDFHEPIMIKAKNAAILQNTCLNCHGNFVHEIVAGSKKVAREQADAPPKTDIRCVHCHRSVGHGA